MKEQKFITDINITDPVPFGLQKFSWTPHDGLNVITGLNGSGKTKLLKYIHDTYNSEYEIRLINVDYPKPNYKQLSDVANSYKRTIDDEIFQDNGSNTGWKSDKKTISTLYLPQVDKDILREIMEIADSFETYKSRNRDKNESEIEKSWTGLTPWNDINKVFKTFRLDIEIRPNGLNGLIKFLKQNIENSYHAENLSSGEQVAYALALWQWGSGVNKKSEILLIDEFDAHLNPSLIKNYINVIREHFVKKGVQVIMTTHNPLITSLLEDKELFWMEKGRMLERSKNYIANVLADGLFSARDLQGIFALFGTTGKTPDKILLTEGKNDELTLLRDIGNDIKILDCKGAPNMPMFVKLPYVQNGDKKPLIVCLLDYDKKGEAIQEQINSLVEKNNVSGNSVKIIFVSDIYQDRMEEVLKDASKKNQLVEKIKNSFKIGALDQR